METVNNNQFEIVPSSKIKRKITIPSTTAYLNPALDLLANEDPMCNTAMEIVPNKKKRRTKSCEIAVFENTGLDLGISKAAINEFLTRELENVRKNIKNCDVQGTDDSKENIEIVSEVTLDNIDTEMSTDEPIYTNISEITQSQNTFIPSSYNGMPETMDLSKIEPNISEIGLVSGITIEPKLSNTIEDTNTNDMDLSAIQNVTNIQKNVTNQIFVHHSNNLSLSFIDRLALDSPQVSNQSLCLDDDLNESNIMEIKTITIITKKKRVMEQKKNTNPFLDPNLDLNINIDTTDNPFLIDETKPELEYTETINQPIENTVLQQNLIMPRRLFTGDTNSTISTVNESSVTIESQNEYENIDNYRSESPEYENVIEDAYEQTYSKQSKILGCDVSHFSSSDILNIPKSKNQNNSNESTDSKKDLKHQFIKASKLPKRVLKKIKKTFKTEKCDHNNTTLNPYEVPRKLPKTKIVEKESGIENPALNLNNSDEIDIEELEEDEEHQYETIKTIRNTQLNMNLTPLRERFIDNEITQNKTLTPSKKVRFDTTMNTEKVITGNSFDYGIQSPGFDAKIDKYHDELENCINEKKFLQQNM